MNHTVPANFDYGKNLELMEIRLRLDFLAKRLDTNLANVKLPRLLEIGIGTGDCTIMLAARRTELTVLDRDPNVCRMVTHRIRSAGHPTPTIVCAAVEDYRFDRHYDAIILQNFLEHVDEPVTLLRSLRNFLTPGGRFYINVPLANSLHRLMGVELGMIARPDELSESDNLYGHRRVYTPGLLLDHLDDANLRPDFEMPYYLKPFSTEMLRSLSEAQHVALFNLGRQIPALASYLYIEAVL